MPEYFYQNKPLSAYSLWELGQFEKQFVEAEQRRKDASEHEKLKKRNIKLPPPNPKFAELKLAIENEIKIRQGIKNV